MLYTIESKNIVLQELSESHIPLLHKWRNEEYFMKNCTMRKYRVSLEEFSEELKKDFEMDRHVQFLIFRKQDMQPIGTIYSYSYSKRDGHCFITTYIIPGMHSRGYGAEAFANFMKHLIDVFCLFKIYNDVYTFNSDSLRMLLKAGFQIEGTFKGHRMFNEVRYDLVRLAFFAGQKDKLTDFLKRFNVPERR